MRICLPSLSAALATVLVVGPACREPAETEPSAVEAEVPDEATVVHGTMGDSLYGTLEALDPDHGAALAAVLGRLLVWDLDVHDLAEGDTFTFAYTWEGEFPEIHALAYRSQQLGRTLRAYRFQASGDRWPSWWDVQGREVPYRLEDSPLRDYPQITSILKDRPTHRGLDFKAPVGTPVLAPKAGRVTRTNWNVRFNGKVIELELEDGTTAKLLHLSEVDVEPGDRVEAGEKIGETGDTGRSTAPHLHYELSRDGETIDPLDYHETFRRTLPEGDVGRFRATRRALDQLLAEG